MDSGEEWPQDEDQQMDWEEYGEQIEENASQATVPDLSQ
jgi:hypothetical protein